MPGPIVLDQSANDTPTDALEVFYVDLRRGMYVEEFLDGYPRILDFVHANGFTADMRLAKGRLKKLRDEVSPVRALLLTNAQPEDWVQFPFDAGPIDCNHIRAGGEHSRIQITIAQARARFNLMKELNEKGSARGYLGITDDRPTSEFKSAMKRERIAYPTVGAQRTLVSSVSLCLRKKSKAQGATTLVVEAPLNNLPVTRVEEVLPDLVTAAANSPFRDVFVVGNGERRSCYRLK
jgi:hypothetical protein